MSYWATSITVSKGFISTGSGGDVLDKVKQEPHAALHGPCTMGVR
jgi:hypothetical protein